MSRRMLYVELDANGQARHLQYAPYLDYRPLAGDEPTASDILARPEAGWIATGIEQKAQAYAIASVVPEHVEEVRRRRVGWVEKTRAAVKDRLTKEIAHWDHRAAQLKAQEEAGRPGARLNSQEARRRAEDLHARLKRRLDELAREAQILAQPPVLIGALVVAPLGLVRQMIGRPLTAAQIDTMAAAARARAIVMDVERGLGFDPVDREFERLGYADLSDFFYVWLRRCARRIYPDLFATVAVPKADELVAASYRHGGEEQAEKYFLDGMTETMGRLAVRAHDGPLAATRDQVRSRRGLPEELHARGAGG